MNVLMHFLHTIQDFVFNTILTFLYNIDIEGFEKFQQKIQNKLLLLICFRKKMSFTGKTSTIEKDAKYRSETKIIQFF